MSYIINRYNGEPLVQLDDATLDNSTSINLIGRNYTGYGESQNENFVFLLENFSNSTSPIRPISGQLWYNSDTKKLNVYDGESWKSASSAEVGPDEPVTAEGALWYKTDTSQLFVYYNSQWNLIGPEGVDGYGVTRVESAIIYDVNTLPHPVLLYKIDGEVLAIVAKNYFTINGTLNPFPGLSSLVPGVNYSSTKFIAGQLKGNADTATRLANFIQINGTNFNGTQDIDITANTEFSLIAGDYITGSEFNGSVARRWDIKATPNNVIGRIVARDAEGNFSANVITGTFDGTLTGNVQVNTGESNFNVVRANSVIGASFSGNAFSATKLLTPRLINGVSFNGTADITVSAAAETLTGSTINSDVVESSLTTVGTLLSLNVAGTTNLLNQQLSFNIDDTDVVSIVSASESGIAFKVYDTSKPTSYASLRLLSASDSGNDYPSLAPSTGQTFSLGAPTKKFTNIYSTNASIGEVNVTTLTSDSVITVNSDITIAGNLTIQGAITTVNSIEVEIQDLNITLASNAANPTAANGAGITIGGAGAALTYTVSGNKWNINRDLDAGENDFITTGLFQGTATSARYADLAENYVSDSIYEPGTVLHFGGAKEVTQCNEDMCKRIAGIVSTNPAYLMNSECAGDIVVPVALQGRVPCKVIGPIRRGDMLVSAGNGYARSEENPVLGSVLGKALVDFDGEAGVIEAVVGRI